MKKRKRARRDTESSANYSVHPDDDDEFNFEKGMTAIAFTFKDGIMVALDHSSQLSKSAKNVVKLNSYMLATISGGGEFILRKLKKKCKLQEKQGKKTTAEDVLKILAEIVSAFEPNLPIGILIAVVNESDYGLYRMNGKGEWVKDTILSTGSGSYASAVVLVGHKDNMSSTEATELAKKAICIAAYRAPESGDICTVYHLGRGGCKKLLEDDMEEWQKANIKSERWKFGEE